MRKSSNALKIAMVFERTKEERENKKNLQEPGEREMHEG